jgi:hypothetical protein
VFGFYLVWIVHFRDVQVGHPQALTKSGEKLMTDRRTQEQAEREPGNTFKDPDDWTTGDEPMTGAQRSYLHTLAGEAGEEVDDGLTKAEASQRIDALQERTGRGG